MINKYLNTDWIFMKNKTPTLKQKVEMYENFLHKINIFIISGNNDGIRELVNNADNWSYAHRSGEFLTDKQRRKMINDMFQKLCDTPKADKATEERQKAWTEQHF
jgi:predicted MPP superfamily phosphohydrolase